MEGLSAAANTFWGGVGCALRSGPMTVAAVLLLFVVLIMGLLVTGEDKRRDETRVETSKEEHGVLVSGRCCLGNGTIAAGWTVVVGIYPLGKKGEREEELLFRVGGRKGYVPAVCLSVCLSVLDMKLRVRPPWGCVGRGRGLGVPLVA